MFFFQGSLCGEKSFMKKLFLLLSLSIILQAQTITAQYKVSYGIFSNLGLADANFTIKDDNYHLIIKAYATGVAKFLSNNKQEIYESIGKVRNQILIPSKFIKTTQNSNKLKRRTYTFDHINKKIQNRTYLKETVQEFDTDFNVVSKEIENNSTSTLKFFSSNDILSLFFNLKTIIPNFKIEKSHTLSAVGGNKKKDGEIIIEIPKEEKKIILNDSLNIKSDIKFIAYINEKIFSSKEGELFVSLNKDYICNKAVLKDVFFFGDIVGELVKYDKL